MTDERDSRELVTAVLRDSRYAVLATAADDQPHASLMAFVARNGGRELVFATYRGTRKHRNLVANPRVALLIDHRETAWLRRSRRLALTAVGRADEVEAAAAPAARELLQRYHPDLAEFLADAESVPMCLVVEGYQVVGGVDRVGWCSADELPPGSP